MKYFLSVCLVLFLLSQCTIQNLINSADDFISVLETELNLRNGYSWASDNNIIDKEDDKGQFYFLINGEPNSYEKSIHISFTKNKSRVKNAYKRTVLTFMNAGPKNEKIGLFTESARVDNNSESKLFSYYENYFFIIEGDKKFIEKSSTRICKYLEQMYE